MYNVYFVSPPLPDYLFSFGACCSEEGRRRREEEEEEEEEENRKVNKVKSKWMCVQMIVILSRNSFVFILILPFLLTSIIGFTYIVSLSSLYDLSLTLSAVLSLSFPTVHHLHNHQKNRIASHFYHLFIPAFIFYLSRRALL